MKNVKDTVTTICGIVGAISGAILAVGTAGVELPGWLKAYAIGAAAVAGAVASFFVGKNPDGSTKTPEQLSKY